MDIVTWSEHKVYVFCENDVFVHVTNWSMTAHMSSETVNACYLTSPTKALGLYTFICFLLDPDSHLCSQHASMGMYC
jgi:hypothetical protein